MLNKAKKKQLWGDVPKGNLWNGTFSETGVYLHTDGHLSSSVYWGVTDYIPLTHTYKYRIEGWDGNMPSICFYDKDKNFISGIAHNNRRSFEFIPPVNAVYMRDSIPLESGLAYVLKIIPKNWNQLIDIKSFSTYTTNGITYMINDNGSVTISGTATDFADFALYYAQATNHRFLFFGSESGKIEFRASGIGGILNYYILTVNIETRLYVRVNPNETVNETTLLNLVDLTDMYGEGLEPTTLEQFLNDFPSYKNYVEYKGV